VCRINEEVFALGLITRRSRHRPGTRYFSRGIDAQGHVSNYVETEQLILYDGPDAKLPLVGKQVLSYVQTRGSIPVYWAQIINLKYTPRLWIGDSKKSVSVTERDGIISDFLTDLFIFTLSRPHLQESILMSSSLSMVPKSL
jgi:hypothetical protein